MQLCSRKLTCFLKIISFSRNDTKVSKTKNLVDIYLLANNKVYVSDVAGKT